MLYGEIRKQLGVILHELAQRAPTDVLRGFFSPHAALSVRSVYLASRLWPLPHLPPAL
jgi:hypothetical protein